MLNIKIIPFLSGDLKFPMVTAYPIKVILSCVEIFSHFDCILLMTMMMIKNKIKLLYLSVNVFSTFALIGDNFPS